MSELDLYRSRKALAAGVGLSTRRNKVLPDTIDPNAIPERVGRGKPILSVMNIVARGFIARIVGAVKAALFAHDTIAMRNSSYPLYGNTYTVLPFATPFNVSDTTLLHDVLSFRAGKVLVNGIGFPLLNISDTAPEKSLPWLIPHPTPVGDAGVYGDTVINATVKRVFAVGRYSVHSWQGVDSALGGAIYRPEKALVCGAKIERSSNVAKLSQLIYTGALWDSLAGGWGMNTAQVTMLLASPYLSKVDAALTVDQSGAVLSSLAPIVGTTTAGVTLPTTELGIIGVGELGSADYTPLIYDMYQNVVFPWRYTFNDKLDGRVSTDETYVRWAGSVTASVDILGITATVSGSNTVASGSHHETYTYLATDIELFASAGVGTASTEGGLCTSSGGIVWTDLGGADLTPRSQCAGSDPGHYYHAAGSIPGSADYITKHQTGEFSVAIPRGNLVSISFSRLKESGNKVVPQPITGRYATPLANPYNWINATSGFGVGGKLKVGLYAPDPPSVLGQRPGPIAARAASRVGGLFYSSFDLDNIAQVYSSTIAARESIDTTSLTWTTTDYILYDDTENVFISVEGEFAGAQVIGEDGEATLTVRLKIDAPAGVQTQTLFSTTLAYSELLPEEFITLGLTAVPSPKQRVIFTPMFREQGDFKGAVYTTAAEATAGAAAACLINFMLKLDTYAAIGTDVSDLPTINFIPCNLLEMLYAYVFSSKYGVDSYNRYPVDYATRYASFIATLFTDTWRVNYRNGILVDWLDTLGGDYVTETTTELSRT